MDQGIFTSVPTALTIFVLSQLALRAESVITKSVREWKKVHRFWKDYFPEFLEGETQNLVGMRKMRQLPDFTALVATRMILPTWEEELKYFWGRGFSQMLVPELIFKKGVNHVIHGNAVVSDISSAAIFKYEHAIDFGYLEGNKIVYDVTPEDYQQASATEVTSREWVIIDKDKRRRKKPLIEPVRLRDGTYGRDGAIIIRCEDPYAERGKVRPGFLGFWGTHAPGSYASDVVFREPVFIDRFEKKLVEKHIRAGDSFIAVVEIDFRPYRFGEVPTDDRIFDLNVKAVELLTKQRT